MTRSAKQPTTDQITLRVDREVGQRLRRIARDQRTSVSRAAGALLAEAVGAPTQQKPAPDVVGNALDEFIGTWTAADARQVSERLADFETIDAELCGTRRRGRRGSRPKHDLVGTVEIVGDVLAPAVPLDSWNALRGVLLTQDDTTERTRKPRRR